MIVKFTFETSKKTLPTAAMFTRAVVVDTFGIVTASEPSFAVLAASTYGYVRPPSVERLIFTFDALVGGMSVLALSQVIVWTEPPGYVTPLFGEVTRNGPALSASVNVTSALLAPPPRWVEVARRQAEVQRRRRVVGGRQELGEALLGRNRHRWRNRARRAGARLRHSCCCSGSAPDPGRPASGSS